ncbi:hypothetical protein BJP34_02905 [Moorena producens PAL-8-15-08-1]|uniref:Uncharacterized protein n=1 Tax=Moorena producens PAL-8-15-08-1 TaxID=1458985 RepID=A0A1D8TLT3_9CYAN|nr:hypothetical protein BJP34_02905 [Moorena producens PAL-8-15-08-1]
MTNDTQPELVTNDAITEIPAKRWDVMLTTTVIQAFQVRCILAFLGFHLGTLSVSIQNIGYFWKFVGKPWKMTGTFHNGYKVSLQEFLLVLL